MNCNQNYIKIHSKSYIESTSCVNILLVGAGSMAYTGSPAKGRRFRWSWFSGWLSDEGVETPKSQRNMFPIAAMNWRIPMLIHVNDMNPPDYLLHKTKFLDLAELRWYHKSSFGPVKNCTDLDYQRNPHLGFAHGNPKKCHRLWLIPGLSQKWFKDI